MISTPITDDLVRGAIELEATDQGLLPHRLPAWARAQNDDGQLAMAEAQPSAVRLVFATEATTVELDAVRTKMAYVGVPDRPDGVYDLVVDGVRTAQRSVTGGNVITVDLATGSTDYTPGDPGTVAFDLPTGPKTVEIWLPFNETTRLVDLRTDAPLSPVAVTRPVWLHHGSSISHGSNAASAATIWPALAAAAGGVELLNLGFGGSALLDPFTARTMRDTPADLISVKLGINIVNADLMRLRAFGPAVHGFLDTLREGHPTTPLLVVSSILCPVHEDTPGPLAPDFDPTTGTVAFKATGDPAEVPAGRLTLNVIRAELARIVQQRSAADPNLSYLDGRELYGPDDVAVHPLPDRVHPDADTHALMGERFGRLVFGPGGPFAG